MLNVMWQWQDFGHGNALLGSTFALLCYLEGNLPGTRSRELLAVAVSCG